MSATEEIARRSEERQKLIDQIAELEREKDELRCALRDSRADVDRLKHSSSRAEHQLRCEIQRLKVALEKSNDIIDRAIEAQRLKDSVPAGSDGGDG